MMPAYKALRRSRESGSYNGYGVLGEHSFEQPKKLVLAYRPPERHLAQATQEG